MGIYEKITNQIQSLINSANEKTGGTATDLTTAHSTLLAGYGAGGGGASGGSGCLHSKETVLLSDTVTTKKG